MGFPNNKITNGLSGSRHISNTDTYTGDFIAVNVIADAKFHTLTGNALDSANATEGSAPLYPAGTVLYGKFTAIKLHSGRVQAYNS